MKKSVFVFAVVALLAVAAVGTAQTTTTIEIRKGTVVAVYGNNLVVKGQDGVTREHDVPAGFTFNIDGKKVPVSELEPGMVLTAAIKTTTTPHVVYTTEIRHGEVLKVVGRTMVVRTEGQTKTFRDVPSDFVFTVDGQEKSVYDLREGMLLTATIVHESMVEIGESDIRVAGTAGSRAAPAPAPAPSTSSSYQTLPETGSSLPLVGLAGLMLLAVAAGISVTRRFV